MSAAGTLCSNLRSVVGDFIPRTLPPTELTLLDLAVETSNRHFRDCSPPFAPRDVRLVARTVALSDAVATLDLASVGFGTTGAAAPAEGLAANATLRHVVLSHDRIGKEGARAIAGALLTNTTMQSLTLRGNRIGDEGATALAVALGTNGTLTEIDLAETGIGTAGATALAAALEADGTVDPFGLMGTARRLPSALAAALTVHQSTRSWYLTACSRYFGAHGVCALARAAAVPSALRRLDLSGNPDIGDAGATALAAALGTNGTLTEIDLFRTLIHDAGATALAAALGTNGALTALGLCHNRIGSEGAKAIATALLTNRTLEALNLGENEIDGEGATALAAALGTNDTLTEIDLCLTDIGAEGMTALAAALGTNRSLTAIHLCIPVEGGFYGNEAHRAVRAVAAAVADPPLRIRCAPFRISGEDRPAWIRRWRPIQDLV